MDALWSVGLVPTYFTHSDYLVVQCWDHATYLFPDTVKQLQPQTYWYVKFSEGWGTTHL